MHYFKRNIGDYHKKAGRLNMLQHGAYTLLIDACYDREKFPTLEEAIEWTWASTSEEVEAVTFVLHKFFILENGVYKQNRIQEEIDLYHAKAETNKRIAIDRETKRKEKSTNRTQDVNEAPPNHKPLTINHKPVSKNIARKTEFFADIDINLVNDYLAVRKAKRAPKVSKTVYDGLVRESNLAGVDLSQALRVCIERNWVGFKAEWYLQLGTVNGKTKFKNKSDVMSDAQFENWLNSGEQQNARIK
jgi:uncharacterized protein YdaU (DUF1376 family)